MNQYERQNAAQKIDGYYNPPRETDKITERFQKAKTECIAHLKNQLENVENMTVDDFIKFRRKPEFCIKIGKG